MDTIDRLDAKEAVPELLWRKYIQKRLPVVIQSPPPEKRWRANLWTNAYLMRKAGHSKVSVEYRSSPSERFGLGKRRHMLFKEFLSRLSQGQENLYVTSPEQPIGPNGFPDVMAPPLLHLSSDLPVRLSWAGNLVPQQINMWMGTSVNGTSSGLHHDYHDNFYVLLRGRKRFRLYPPSLAKRMYTHGKISRIFPNGRIVYKGQQGILEDGSNEDDVREWKLSKSSEEDHIDEDQDFRHDDEENESMQSNTPPSFSMVDISLPIASIQERFPNFPHESFVECIVSAGETLYLPAGWFHEVTSMNDTQGKEPGHLAINYWLHPPDNIRAGDRGFFHPYKTGFWNDMWSSGKIRMGMYERSKSYNKARRRKISQWRQRYGKLWIWFFLKDKRKNKYLSSG